MSREFYTVSELGALLNIPRTTINDYLAKYAGYFPSEVRGKRRVYLPPTPEILQDIASMRNAGMSARSIEEELMHRYAMNAEVQENGTFNTPNAEVNMSTQNEGRNPGTLVAVDEIKAIGQYLAKAEETRRREFAGGVRRLFLPMMLIVVMVILLAAGGLLAAARLMRELKREFSAAEESHSLRTAELTGRLDEAERKFALSMEENTGRLSDDQRRRMEDVLFKLDEKNQLQRDELTKLHAELLEQRKAESERFRELRESMTGRMEKEVELVRADYEARLGDLTAAKSKVEEELSAAADKLQALFAANAELENAKKSLEARIKELEGKLAELRSSLKDAEYARDAAADLLARHTEEAAAAARRAEAEAAKTTAALPSTADPADEEAQQVDTQLTAE